MFKDPCIGLAEKLIKALVKLAKSTRDRRHCSLDFDQLHKAMEEVNTILKSLPRLSQAPTITRPESSAPKVEENERQELRPQMSEITITNLEFSEALHFASFLHRCWWRLGQGWTM